jgi:hypothetical protein
VDTLIGIGIFICGALVGAGVLALLAYGWFAMRSAAVLQAENRAETEAADIAEQRLQLDAERRELYEWRRRLDDQSHRPVSPSDLAPVINVGRHSTEAAWGTRAQVSGEETGLIDASRADFVLSDGWDAARTAVAGGSR